MKHVGDGIYSADGDTKSVIVAVANNVNKGKATVVITGSKSVIKKSFKINAADISKAKIEVVDDAAFAVKGAKPEIKVTYQASEDDDEIELAEGMDYKVTYKNFKAVGSASFILKGKGNFSKKTGAQSYSITAFDLSEVDADDIAVSAYTGIKAGKVKVTIADANGNIIPAKNLTVEVFQGGEAALGKKDKLAAGEATVKVSAKSSNITGSVEKSIVVGANLGKAKVNAKGCVKTYTGEAVTLEEEDFANIIVTLGKGKTLVYGTDFVVAAYENNYKKGKMKVTIEGIGEYSGTKTFKVVIDPQTMKNAD